MPVIPSYGTPQSTLFLGNYLPLQNYLYANQGRSTQFSDPEVAQMNANAAATQAAAAAKTPAAAGTAAPSLGATGLDESIYNAYRGSFDWSTLGAGSTMTNTGPVQAPVAAAPTGTPPATPTPGGGTGSGMSGTTSGGTKSGNGGGSIGGGGSAAGGGNPRQDLTSYGYDYGGSTRLNPFASLNSYFRGF